MERFAKELHQRVMRNVSKHKGPRIDCHSRDAHAEKNAGNIGSPP